MKTLVIHPYDPTTQMLAHCYQGKDWTVITDISTPKRVIKHAIKYHDRIIMLGHGTSKGLMCSLGKFSKRMLIDSSLVYLLRDKKALVGIWCDADEFFDKYDLKGFYTGMIISEYDEALMCCVNATQDEIDDSNTLFGDAITESIDSDDMLSSMKRLYVGDTPVINFNKVRLFKKD